MKKYLAVFTVITLSGLALAQNFSVTLGKAPFVFLDTPAAPKSRLDSIVVAISEFSQVLASKGTRLVLVMPPLAQRTYDDYLPSTYEAAPGQQEQYDYVVTHLRSRQVLTVDLAAAYRQSRAAQSDLLFAPFDHHWSQFGVAVAARATAGYLTSKGVTLSKVPKVEYRLELKEPVALTPTRTNNAARLTDDQYRTWATTFKAVLRPMVVTRVTPEALLGGPEPQVALVGTSFSDDRLGFASALAYYLSRDVLNVSKGGAGPYNPMLDYLNGPEFKATSPQLLIWEFPEMFLPAFVSGSTSRVGDPIMWAWHTVATLSGACGKSAGTSVTTTGVGVSNTTRSVTGIETAATTSNSYIEYRLGKPYPPSYLHAHVRSVGVGALFKDILFSKSDFRRYEMPVPLDGEEHSVDIPLVNGDGSPLYAVRLLPGITTAFSVSDVELCQYPAEVVKALSAVK